MTMINSLAVAVAVAILGTSVSPSQLNPAVTQANIQQTICTYGWSKIQRSAKPPQYYWSIKHKMLAGRPAHLWILDHKVSIELGGSATSTTNMQLQLVADATKKDQAENYLHSAVCANKVPLATAQTQINGWHP